MAFAEAMVNDWTPYEEDLLVENLEMGYDLVAVSRHVQRDPEDVAKKVVELPFAACLSFFLHQHWRLG